MADKRRNESVFAEIINKINALPSFSDFSVDDLIAHGKEIGQRLAKKPIELKTSQIRRFFDSLKNIQSKITKESFEQYRDEIVLLRPKLAYAAGRQRRQVEDLMKVLDPAISKIENYEDFNCFIQFVETIVAYHKYAGGGE